MDHTLIGLLRASVERYPDKCAIEKDDTSVTYSELWNKAGAVARQLVDQGLAEGQRVGLLIENSPQYVISYYAILIAGGVVVGLNTAARCRDIANWILHSESRFLILDSAHPESEVLLKEVADHIDHCIVIGQCDLPKKAIAWDQIADGDALIPNDIDKVASRQLLAAIIYTSGTTGRPKGVMLSHGNLYANICSIVSYLELSESDSIVNLLPFYYTYGNTVLHSHLAVGGSIILENSLLYPHTVLQKICTRRVSGFSGVPSTFNLLLNRTNLEDFDLSGLRYITQAGGHMLPVNIRRTKALIPSAQFFVMYGQTEACSRLSYLPPEEFERKPGSVGIAIPGVELDIRDEAGNSLPPRETGEIHARGKNIMLGYWKDADESSRVLVDGWLKTGDLAYRDEDGYFYIVGRSTEIIKSGAHRISPADIEEVIAEIDGIEEVAAVGVEDELLGQVVKVVIVKSPGTGIEKIDIMRHCKQNLANYKIPKIVEFLDEIPRTTTGKIQKFKLIESSE